MNKNVLVADDDQAIRALVAKALESIGVENITETTSGDEALALWRQQDFDLVLLDWEMPGMSGIEVLRAIRASDADVPVVMITAEAKRGSVKEAAAAGATQYLIKPFDADTLKDTLEVYCRTEGVVDTVGYRCREVMNTDLITIHPDASISDAIALLLEHGISGLPVVDDANKLLGIITEFPLIAAITRPELEDDPVSSVMSTDVIAVTENTLPLEVVQIMQMRRIRRVPVVRNGELVGLISRRDVLRYVSENKVALREFLDEVRSAASA